MAKAMCTYTFKIDVESLQRGLLQRREFADQACQPLLSEITGDLCLDVPPQRNRHDERRAPGIRDRDQPDPFVLFPAEWDCPDDLVGAPAVHRALCTWRDNTAAPEPP